MQAIRVGTACRAAGIVVSLLSVVACDPEEVVNKYFKEFGLTRLAAPRTEINPGDLLVVASGKAFYADNLLDYVQAESATAASAPVLLAAERIKDYEAVLRKYDGDKQINGSLALKFLDKVIPGLNMSNKLELKTNVNIGMTTAKVRRWTTPSLQGFLKSTDAKAVRQQLRELEKSGDIYIVYEAWRANKLKITASGGGSFDTSIGVGKVVPVSDGEAKFGYKYTSKTELEIVGDGYYVFAVRTARLVFDSHADVVSLDLTNFAKPAGWGILGVGGDDKYTSTISGVVPVDGLRIDRRGF